MASTSFSNTPYASELSDEVIEVLTEALGRAPLDECEFTLYQMGGAVADVTSDATAFGFRDPAFLLCVSAAWDDPEMDEETVAWAREAWETLRKLPVTIEGFYPGFPGFVEGEERARMAYGDNYDRLVAIKTDYDLENRFRHNLNVEPAVD